MPDLPVERRIVFGQLEARLREIAKSIYLLRHPITDVAARVTGPDLGPERAPQSGFRKFKVPDHWGGFDQTTWFRIRVTVPESFAGQEVVALIHPGGESLAFVDGVPAQGLDEKRDMLLLTDKAKGGEELEILLESVPSTRFDQLQVFDYADLAVRQTGVWDYYWDVRVVLDLLKEFDENDTNAQRMLEVLDTSVKMVDLSRNDNEALLKDVDKARRKLSRDLKAFRGQDGSGRLTLVGHSHIDTAWLWPMRETERKTGRTFSTVLSLMDRYPRLPFLVQPAGPVRVCEEALSGDLREDPGARERRTLGTQRLFLGGT